MPIRLSNAVLAFVFGLVAGIVFGMLFRRSTPESRVYLAPQPSMDHRVGVEVNDRFQP